MNSRHLGRSCRTHLLTGLLAVTAVFGLVTSSHACNGAGGGSRSGGQPGGGPGAGGSTASVAQAMMAMQAAQMAQNQQQATNQYVASMHAQHNMMLQQMHQRQFQQLQAMRQASMKKKAAAARTIEVSSKSQGKVNKSVTRSSKSTAPSV